ncbi:hypothetical protein STA3757_45260 [Stanieria sp. NIES-3757]|nr:hypothetical protein STA3757_45260 [Stanieria sp. NIES-3757]
MEVVLGLVTGLILGGLGVWLIMRSQIQGIKSQKQASDEKANLYCSQRETLSQENNENKQKIDELKNDLQQIKLENIHYKEEIELANQKSAEANAQKEQIQELRQKLENKNKENQELRSQTTNLAKELASLSTKLQEEQRSNQEKLALLRNTQQNLTDTFKALSAEALQNNNQQFLEVAKTTFENIYQLSQHKLEEKEQAIKNLVSPLKKSLEDFNQQIREVENARLEDKVQISEQLKSVAAAQFQLQAETANLSKALRQPIVRGRWGEIQLKRVVEMSGMQEYCDFTVQETVNTENGLLRPDLVVKLPGKKQVIVDSKAPLQAYLQAIEAQEESIQLEYLKNHARHIRNHVNQLSSKNYWGVFEQTPEFVIMFLPGEVFFSAALQQDPELIEFGIERKVILATPTTLITLLKTIEYGWRQERVAENAQAIGNLGRELYDRFLKFTEHLINVRKKLDDTVKAYNTTIGSYESRLLVTAKKFQEIGGYGNDEIESIKPIDSSVRLITQENNSAIE